MGTFKSDMDFLVFFFLYKMQLNYDQRIRIRFPYKIVLFNVAAYEMKAVVCM